MLSLSACRPLRPAPPAAPEVVAVTAASENATATVAVAPTEAPPLPTATQPEQLQPTAPASPFDTPFDDRDIYAGGLVPGERSVLQGLPGAPVYHIDVAIDDAMTTVAGRQTLFYTNQEDVTLSEVYFHLHPRTLDGAIAVADVTVDGAATAIDSDGAILRVSLPVPLAPGESATIALRFETTVPTSIGRNYGVLAYYDNTLALAHFYPMLAVYDDEGWNIAPPDIQGDLTYSDAAFYLVRVSAPADVVLAGAGTIVDETREGDRQTVTYALGPARDFYLAAGDFVVVSHTTGETTVNSYAPAYLLDGASLALDVATRALTTFNEQLGPYPYTELDIVTTPTSALGIEYPGLIAGTVNMYDIGRVTRDGRTYRDILESTTVHEVAHQWFYNIVGNDQLDEPWLDEALASYYAYRFYLSRYGPATADDYFGMFYSRYAGMTDVKPAGLPVDAYEDNEYSAAVYGRGPVFVRTLEETMGRGMFDAFLRDYVARYRWQIATTAEFRALAEQHCACDLGPLFAEWIYE